MKRLLLLITLTGLLPRMTASAYPLKFVENFYALYHQELYNYPADVEEGIGWLLVARSAPFANPLNALARVEDEQEWELYRNLFLMHINLSLVRCYMRLGDTYDKHSAYFFNAPFKERNLESLEIAEAQYRLALVYWQETVRWSERVNDEEFRWLYLEEIAGWHDEAELITTDQLDYEAIIHRHLNRLERVRREFEAMNEFTY